ncbi:hypothetical protein E4U61_000172 [Claviceps capensis]|nr:hypothetical protein E4U61_000172 [Claviceps capensis]
MTNFGEAMSFEGVSHPTPNGTMSNPVNEALTGAYNNNNNNNMVKSLAEFGMVTIASEEMFFGPSSSVVHFQSEAVELNWTKQMKQAEPWKRATRHLFNDKENEGRQTRYVIQEALA